MTEVLRYLTGLHRSRPTEVRRRPSYICQTLPWRVRVPQWPWC